MVQVLIHICSLVRLGSCCITILGLKSQTQMEQHTRYSDNVLTYNDVHICLNSLKIHFGLKDSIDRNQK